MKKSVWTMVVTGLLSGLAHLSFAQSDAWQPQAAGLPTGKTTKNLIFSAVDSLVCWATPVDDAGGPAIVIRTTDGGRHWFTTSVPDAYGYDAVGISALDSLTAWVVFEELTIGGFVYATTDGGASWRAQTTPLYFYGTGSFIKFFDSRNGLVGGGPAGDGWEVYTTSDGGARWTKVYLPPPALHEAAYLPCPTASHGNSFWFTSSKGSLYKSTDRGHTWTVSQNVFPGAQWIGVAFKDSLNGLITDVEQLGPGLRIRKTTDGGATFVDVNRPEGMSCAYVTYVPGTSGTYIVSGSSHPWRGTTGGSAFSPDDGATWSVIDRLDHGQSVFVSPTAGWIAGDNDSLYRWNGRFDGSHVSPVLDRQENPREFALGQNYPNPFNPQTEIRFQLESAGHVRLVVYDLLGREVGVLVDEQKPAGEHQVRFGASGLTSGVYLYSLRAGDLVQTRKMTVVK